MTQENLNLVRTPDGKASQGTRDLSQARLNVEEWEAIWPRCWRRIRLWRVPPRWNYLDWWNEARAEAALAACAAAFDFDPALGVPPAAFLYRRILAGVWTRYRQEWAYGRPLCVAHPLGEWPTADDSSSSGVNTAEVARLLGRLNAANRWLIQQLFWEGKTEAAVARDLGISQQAVSERRLGILRSLRPQASFIL